jgi:chloramphenicol O-acetyltransferase type A
LYHGGMNSEGRYRVIDQESWPRKEQFELFHSFGFPYFSLTVDIDITAYRSALPKGGRFTIGLAYALAAAANRVPEFRQRLRGNDVIEFETVHPSIIVLTKDEAFRFCVFPFAEDFATFSANAPERMEKAQQAPSMFSEPDQEDFLYLTGIPWISFTGLMHPLPMKGQDSVPRIAWGKYRDVGGRTLLPLNVQVHHALVDGIHAGRFFAGVEEKLADAKSWLQSV